MILDRITNIHLFSDMNPMIVQALSFLKDTDFQQLKPGRYEIAGEDLFLMVSDYKTREMEDCRLEAHRKYIDIHFMAEGSELIGYSSFNDQEQATEYDAENDFILYCGEKNYLKLTAGMFAIFYPSDLHMPGIMINKPGEVRKVVVKVRLPQIDYSLV
jgi:YhcH/YjgK/YiaL family protein